jgi:hypothetical protein
LSVADDGWRYRPKHAEQFSRNKKTVKLHLVGNISKGIYSEYSVMGQRDFCISFLGKIEIVIHFLSLLLSLSTTDAIYLVVSEECLEAACIFVSRYRYNN